MLFNSLWHSDVIWCQDILVDIGSAYGMLPDGTKPLPKAMLTNYQLDHWEQWILNKVILIQDNAFEYFISEMKAFSFMPKIYSNL